MTTWPHGAQEQSLTPGPGCCALVGPVLEWPPLQWQVPQGSMGWAYSKCMMTAGSEACLGHETLITALEMQKEVTFMALLQTQV